ncbi:unnamed protein product [Cyclocybe aegerita]|uniref:Uncharacterized protein n=1 Tax=Cyclocybe aegerita TaxID=1973307 RepID=A0A8S0WDK0_CYCAE|nr:unnamed protein product [Cyclocybe aegerita]
MLADNVKMVSLSTASHCTLRQRPQQHLNAENDNGSKSASELKAERHGTKTRLLLADYRTLRAAVKLAVTRGKTAQLAATACLLTQDCVEGPPTPPATLKQMQATWRSLAQKARRARERAAQGQLQDSNLPTSNAGAPPPSNRTLAQRARRERERAAREGIHQDQQVQEPKAPQPSNRTLAQRARRERERAAQHGNEQESDYRPAGPKKFERGKIEHAHSYNGWRPIAYAYFEEVSNYRNSTTVEHSGFKMTGNDVVDLHEALWGPVKGLSDGANEEEKVKQHTHLVDTVRVLLAAVGVDYEVACTEGEEDFLCSTWQLEGVVDKERGARTPGMRKVDDYEDEDSDGIDDDDDDDDDNESN